MSKEKRSFDIESREATTPEPEPIECKATQRERELKILSSDKAHALSDVVAGMLQQIDVMFMITDTGAEDSPLAILKLQRKHMADQYGMQVAFPFPQTQDAAQDTRRRLELLDAIINLITVRSEGWASARKQAKRNNDLKDLFGAMGVRT